MYNLCLLFFLFSTLLSLVNPPITLSLYEAIYLSISIHPSNFYRIIYLSASRPTHLSINMSILSFFEWINIKGCHTVNNISSLPILSFFLPLPPPPPPPFFFFTITLRTILFDLIPLGALFIILVHVGNVRCCPWVLEKLG